MNKDEIRALGVPEDKIQAFQKAYNRDLQKAAKRQIETETPGAEMRAAILTMLKLIQREDSLHNILIYVNRAYYSEPAKQHQAHFGRKTKGV